MPFPHVESMKLIIQIAIHIDFEFYWESFLRVRRQIADDCGIWDKRVIDEKTIF
jgi:hypothetical protein